MQSSLIGRHWNCLPDKNYEDGVMRFRLPNQDLYNEMLKSECREWVFVQEGSNDGEEMHQNMG
jgi:hypothetical protein